MFLALKNPANNIVKVGGYSCHPALNGVPDEIGGKWHMQGYNFGEGAIVKVWVRIKKHSAAVPVIAAQYIQMRSEAAHRKISIPLLNTAASVISEAGYTGRFDLLTLRQAIEKGVPVSAEYAYQAAPVHASTVFVHSILEPAISSPVKIVAETIKLETGEEREFVKPTRNRHLAL